MKKAIFMLIAIVAIGLTTVSTVKAQEWYVFRNAKLYDLDADDSGKCGGLTLRFYRNPQTMKVTSTGNLSFKMTVEDFDGDGYTNKFSGKIIYFRAGDYNVPTNTKNAELTFYNKGERSYMIIKIGGTAKIISERMVDSHSWDD